MSTPFFFHWYDRTLPAAPVADKVRVVVPASTCVTLAGCVTMTTDVFTLSAAAAVVTGLVTPAMVLVTTQS